MRHELHERNIAEAVKISYTQQRHFTIQRACAARIRQQGDEQKRTCSVL
jgi:hypothetical protein